MKKIILFICLIFVFFGNNPYVNGEFKDTYNFTISSLFNQNMEAKSDTNYYTNLISTLGGDGKFNNVDYSNHLTREPTLHLDKVMDLVYYVNHAQPPLESNDTLLINLRTAMEYWSNHYIDSYSPNPFYNDYWALYLTAKSLFLYQATNITLPANTTVLDNYTYSSSGLIKAKFTNALIITYKSLILGDEVALKSTMKSLWNLLSSPDNGVKVDGSFLIDGPISDSGVSGYFISEFLQLLVATNNTGLAIPSSLADLFGVWALQGNQWMSYSKNGKTFYHPATVGMNIATKMGTTFTIPQKNLRASPIRNAEFNVWANRISGADPSLNTGNRQFYHSDLMIHSRKDYTSSLRYPSKRTLNANCIDKLGSSTQKMADGSFFLIVDGGKEFEDIYPIFNWDIIPGTTTEFKNSLNNQLPNCTKDVAVPGKTSFDGSLSDGLYGIAATDFKATYADMKAKKSWFFFDEHIVCLGSNITSNTTNSGDMVLASVIDQRYLVPPIYSSSGNTSNLVNITWYHHNKIAYLFPSVNSSGMSGGPVITPVVIAENQNINSQWSKIGTDYDNVQGNVHFSFFNHLNFTEQNSYQYIMVPNIEYSNFTTRIDPLFAAINIMRNDDHFHAVLHNKLNILQIVFWDVKQVFFTPFGFNITASAPILLQVNMINSTDYDITVSDPSQTLSTVQVVFRFLELKGPFSSFTSKTNFTTISIQLPSGEFTGAANTWNYKVLSRPVPPAGYIPPDVTTSSPNPNDQTTTNVTVTPTSPSAGSTLTFSYLHNIIILFISIIINFI